MGKHLIADRDPAVQILDLTDGTTIWTLQGHTRGVQAVAFGQIQGRPIAVTGSYDGTVRVWDLTDGTARALLPIAGCTGLALHDSTVVVTTQLGVIVVELPATP